MWAIVHLPGRSPKFVFTYDLGWWIKAPKVVEKHESALDSIKRLAKQTTSKQKQQNSKKTKETEEWDEEKWRVMTFCCTLQSTAVETTGDVVTNEETTNFVDVSNDIVAVENGMTPGPASVDRVEDGELAKFLARPIRILNFTWEETDTASVLQTIDPWTLYLNTAIIKKKLDNYAWFRGNLHVKIVINASPFYYGLMMASYKPLSSWAAADSGDSALWYANILRSQRPHVMLLPAESMGGEMKLPFIFPSNYVGIQDASEVAAMGRLTFTALSTLKSANGVTDSGVTVQCFAWMEDVELHGPTVGVALQSEYTETGAVSSMASTVASVANRFSTVPFVGKFMKATSIGASAIGSIASLFGFTNVPVLESAAPVRPNPFPPLATTEIGYPTEKLTLDPKNELAIDGAPLGLDLQDDLQISRVVQREAILAKAVWSTADLVDAQLFRACVTPDLYDYHTETNQYQVYLTPMAWVAKLFRHWRGDVIFRFDFIKSKYHRGRVVVGWEPVAVPGSNLSTQANTLGTVISKVVDLGAESSVEVRIPYSQAYPWLKRYTGTVVGQWNVNGDDENQSNYNQGYHNGLLVMRVLNALTAPVASSTIDVIISVRGAENLEFANPVDPPQWSQYEVQSSRVFELPAEEAVMGVNTKPSEDRFSVNMGESVRSLRQILRRSCINEIWEAASNTTDQLALLSHTQTRFPLCYGYDPGAPWTAAGLAAPEEDFPFSYTRNTPYNWIAPAFAGVRGSMMWHYNFVNQSAGTFSQTSVKVTRTPFGYSGDTGRNFFTQATKTGINDASFWIANTQGTGGGTSLTNTVTNAGISVSLPNYSQALFQSTRADFAMTPGTGGTLIGNAYDEDFATLEVALHPAQGQTTRALTIEKYCGAGTDLSLNFFINVPVWYAYRGTPAP